MTQKKGVIGMNDTLFECTYTDSEALLRESYTKVQFRKKVELGWALMGFALCVFALAFWMAKPVWRLIGCLLIVGGGYLLWQPVGKAKNVMDSILRNNHGTVPTAKIVVTDRITHYYKLDTAVLLFADLRYVYFLKHSVVLIGEETYVTFDRNGFTKGSPEEFEAFLKEKYPHVEIFHKT